MARIVKLRDSSPFIVKAEDLAKGPCAVCRCGLSGAWPMCDGSHKQTRDEVDGRLYAYTRDGDRIERHDVHGVGDLEPLLETKTTVAPAAPGDVAASTAHTGDGARRPRRPEQAKESSKGNEAGNEPASPDPTAGGQDELLEAGGSQRSTRDEIRVKGSTQDEPSQAV